MKTRLLLLTVIIAVLVLISGFLTMISQSFFAKRTASIIETNYENNGRNIAETIDASFKKGIEVSKKTTDYIYSEMINDLKSDKQKYAVIKNAPVSMFDTITEGFYFSNKENPDSFVINIFEGQSLYVIKREKSFFKELEKNTGPGKYVQDLGNLSSIEYIAIQDEQGILTATANVSSLSSLFADSSLAYSFVEGEPVFRKTMFGKREIFEYIYPVNTDGYIIRIGFESKMIYDAASYSSKVILSLFLIIISSGVFILLMLFYYTRSVIYSQKAVDQEKEKEKYISLISDGLVVFEDNFDIKTSNGQLSDMFSVKHDNVGKVLLKNKKIKEMLLNKKNILGELISVEGRQVLVSSVYLPDKKNTIMTFNDITEMEKLREENEVKERSALLGELSFKVAHELKNPLNGISIILQRILRKTEMNLEEREMLGDALEEVGRMNQRITDFTKFAKPLEYKITDIRMKELMDEIIESVKPAITEKRISIHQKIEECVYKGDRGHIKDALRNIVINGIEAVENEGKVEIAVKREGNNILIDVSDNGPGLREDIKERVLELYFTTKEKGSGIGLTSAYRTIKESGGELNIEKSEMGGALFRIKLPVRGG